MTANHMEYAAHVDHPISHSSSTAQIGLGIALALTAIGTDRKSVV